MPYVPLRRGAGRLFDENLNAMLKELFEMGLSQFGERLVAERTPVIELNSAYGVSNLRDVQTVSGTATIASSSTGEIAVSTGATASSTARLDSSERLRYIPGFGAEVGVGVRIPTAPTGEHEAKWGLRSPNGNEGFYFGMDATGVYVAHSRNGTETKIRQTDWNIDKMDGRGESRLTLDMTEGNIFQIDFTWYGYGQIIWEIINVVDGKQKPIPVHQFKPSGATSVQSPNLPIFVEATNGATASNFAVYVGGRQASVVGRYEPKFRTTSEYRSAVSTSTTRVPLISFRNKSGFEDRSLQLDASTAVVATNDHIIEFFVGGSLTGASYGTPSGSTAAESSVEVDIAATAISGGTLVYSYYATAGSANKENSTGQPLFYDVPENQVLTMTARTVTSTGTAAGFFRVREEW